MVVGFVNSGLMSLTSAVWVIMGANIGTTITGQLIAINITALAPLFAFIGVAMIVFFKSKKIRCYWYGYWWFRYFIYWNGNNVKGYGAT